MLQIRAPAVRVYGGRRVTASTVDTSTAMAKESHREVTVPTPQSEGYSVDYYFEPPVPVP